MIDNEERAALERERARESILTFGLPYNNIVSKIRDGRAVIIGREPDIDELFAAIKERAEWRRKKRIKRPSVYIVLSARHDKKTGNVLRTFKECAEVFDRSITVYRYWYTEALIISRSIYRELKTAGKI